jgi:hypothetical protein
MMWMDQFDSVTANKSALTNRNSSGCISNASNFAGHRNKQGVKIMAMLSSVINVF